MRTPFLLDDGTVATAYGTLGQGMHPGLPGHSFVRLAQRARRPGLKALLAATA